MSKYEQIVEAVGEEKAEQLIVQDMGTVEAVYDHLVSIGSITEDGGTTFLNAYFWLGEDGELEGISAEEFAKRACVELEEMATDNGKAEGERID